MAMILSEQQLRVSIELMSSPPRRVLRLRLSFKVGCTADFRHDEELSMNRGMAADRGPQTAKKKT
jgi:hypothetical protein